MMTYDGSSFNGAKVALFIGDQLLITLRDDFAHIPYPNTWDFPGGGREADETPMQTVLRETQEEVGLVVPPEAFVWQREYEADGGPGMSWFFVARLPAGAEAGIVFGDEGQGWKLVPLEAFLEMDDAVPSFAGRLRDWMATGGRNRL